MYNWNLLDDDSLQYGRKIGKRKYEFIQANWLDGDDEYCVCADEIDLNETSANDIECAISSYGYSLEGLYKEYGSVAEMLIAECVFESHQGDYNCISGVVTFEEAKRIVETYIKERR